MSEIHFLYDRLTYAAHCIRASGFSQALQTVPSILIGIPVSISSKALKRVS